MNTKQSIAYASLARRFRAVLIDGLALAGVLAFSIWLVLAMGLQHHAIAPYLALGPAVLMEPLLVTFTGGSVGHHMTGLRVRQLAANSSVRLLPALFRFVIKTALGWLSLLMVQTTKHHQGIHDVLTRTIVVHKNPGALLPHQVLTEREVEAPGYRYPSRFRRLGVTLCYLLLGFLAYSVASAVLHSEECLIRGRCNGAADSILLLVLGSTWIISVFVTCATGWTGKLPGAKRKPLQPAQVQ